MESRSKKILQMLNLPKYETTKGLDEDLRTHAIAKFKANQFFTTKNVEENRPTKTNNNYCWPSSSSRTLPSSSTGNKENVFADLDTTKSTYSIQERTLGKNNKINVLSHVIISGGTASSTSSADTSNVVHTINADSAAEHNSSRFGTSSPDSSNVVHTNAASAEESNSSRFGSMSHNSSVSIFDNCFKQKSTDYDSMSESITSGSEYVPSDDNGHVSSTTEEETSILIERNKKIKNKTIQNIETHHKVVSTTTATLTRKNNQKMHKILRTNDHQKRICTVYPPVDQLPDSLEFTDIDVVTSSTHSSSMTASNVEILAAAKNEGKRIRNKGHSCYFCQRVVQNSARHFELLHSKESEVAKLLAKPKYSKDRRDGFANLIRVGDFYHNTDVLSMKKGELILVRRPSENEAKFVTTKDYGPCPHCLGFMLKKHLWHHFRNCNNARNSGNKNIDIIGESEALLNDVFGTEFSNDFVTNITSKLRDDDVGIYCKEDLLIQRFGAMQFEKYGTTQCEMIRQSMRQLARLTLKLREIGNTNKNLSDFLVPQMFDLIIQATKALCVTHQNSVRRPEFEIPSLALKTGYALKKCAGIKRGTCLRAGNLSGNEILTCFLSLMDLEWNPRISSNALATLYNRKMNATQLLPLTSDLIKLSQYLNSEMKKTQQSLSEDPSLQKWALLACLTLSKIILFNKRRSGEAARMTICHYSSRPKWSDQCTDELKKSLSDFERRLADQLTLVEIIGKRGRKVPILLTQDVKMSVDKLIQLRDEVNIDKGNPYIFARTGNSNTNLRGHECLRKVCSDAGLEHAEYVTSTKLRKYIATVCQVFNLSENDYDWLARHLGHDIRVHREFYRLHESAVELTKVSRLLIAVDMGEVSSFAGKSLEDINLEDIPGIDENGENGEDSSNEMTEKDGENMILEYNEQTSDFRKTKAKNSSKTDRDASPVLMAVARREAQPKTSKSTRRRAWSAEEKESVLKYFKNNLKKGVLPGKADCIKCMEKNKNVLSLRLWTDIKFCIKNELEKIKKMKK